MTPTISGNTERAMESIRRSRNTSCFPNETRPRSAGDRGRFLLPGSQHTAFLEIPAAQLRRNVVCDSAARGGRCDAAALAFSPAARPSAGKQARRTLAFWRCSATYRNSLGCSAGRKIRFGSICADVQQQRRRDLAHGFSLDKLGEDLRVPRFPPREHSFDPDTIALYHLNERRCKQRRPTVLDETTRFGLAGHPGVNRRARRVWRSESSGTAFAFPARTATAPSRFPTDAEFDLPRNRSFTVEAFVNVDPAMIRRRASSLSKDQ